MTQTLARTRRMSHAISFLRVVVAIIVVVFALIGFLYVTRGGAFKRVRSVGVASGAVSPDEPEFALSVAMATGVLLLPDNHVEIAKNGDGTFSRLWEDLRASLGRALGVPNHRSTTSPRQAISAIDGVARRALFS